MRVLALIAVLAGPASAQDRSCDGDLGALPQQAINACLAERYTAREAGLAQAYAAALAVLPEEDRTALRAAQLAWTTFRAQACHVEAGAMRGGSGEAMLLYGCLVRLTERRTEDLAQIVSWRNQ
ncbi:lysozyme inhibitor LprI family protein [Roseicyclus sp.]|uniref:lysozyme inhibitor LprI family protein n=1 Tax=Roseicyclus sp. TaxID=1914329 RepID=UPI003FA144B0